MSGDNAAEGEIDVKRNPTADANFLTTGTRR
jgi:hypothetical protein